MNTRTLPVSGLTTCLTFLLLLMGTALDAADVVITSTNVNCTYSASTTTSSFTLDLTVTSATPGAAGEIVVSYAGTELTTVTEDASGTTTFTGLALPGGPANNALISVRYDGPTPCDVTTLVDLVACTDACDGSGVGGTVTLDANNNGTLDAGDGEGGQSNVLVEVYDCAEMLVCSTYTNAAGEWSCPNLPSGGEDDRYRVEYSTPLHIHLAEAYTGPDNAGSVQFLAGGDCTSNYSVTNPACLCEAVPDLTVPCYINGDPAMATADDEALVQFSSASTGQIDEATGGNAPDVHPGSAPQIGSTWGTATQRSTGRIFAGAFLKRHAGLGPGGIDAIYVAGEGEEDASTLWLDGALNTDVSAAVNPAAGVTAVPDNAARGLAGSVDPNYDAEVFPLIGKVGFGDLDISEDDNTLYVVNMADRTLNVIDIASVDAGSPDIQTIEIPLPTCTGGVARPMGLGVRNGKVYIGAACTGELSVYDPQSGVPDQTTTLEAYVFEYAEGSDVIASQPVLQFSLDYDGVDGNNDKGCTASSGNAACRWYTWIDEYIDLDLDPASGVQTNPASPYDQGFSGQSTNYMAPQPMFSNIDFDKEGFMILSFMDRLGHQLGWINHKPIANPTTELDRQLVRNTTGGDILLAEPTDGTFSEWVLESNGSTPSRMTAGTGTGQNGNGGPNTNQGPGGGEFFFTDRAGGAHSEIHAGSTIFLGSQPDRIYAVTMDANTGANGGTFRTAGMQEYNLANGSTFDFYQIVPQVTDGPNVPDEDNDSEVFFGKSGSLGDISAICTPTAVQIGNYAWIDENMDGIQTACEPPVVGLRVDLYSNPIDGSAPVLLATAVTDAAGRYTFTGEGIDGAGTTWLVSDSVDIDEGYFVSFRSPVADRYFPEDDFFELDGVLYRNTLIGAGAAGRSNSDADVINVPGVGERIGYAVPAGGLRVTNSGFDAGFLVVCPELALVDTLPEVCVSDTILLAGLIDSIVGEEVYEFEYASSGDGEFVDAAGMPTVAFNEAVAYRLAPTDGGGGTITISLAVTEASTPDGCVPVMDEIEITVLDANCGAFFWDGDE